jgi:AraC-like DNA-binding protein
MKTFPWSAADPLGEALHALRMTGAFYCRSELTAPWGLALPPLEGCLWFHVVTAGGCLLEVPGLPAPRPLAPGQLALVPHGAGHTLVSAPGAATPRVDSLRREQHGERYEVLRHGGGGAPTALVCGAVAFEHPAARHLVRLLPALLHLEAAQAPERAWLEGTLRLMAVELERPRPGGETVITRLADILVIQALRAWLEQGDGGGGRARTGWLGALQDPQVGQALAAIHREPERAWTVASLARRAGMSRSAFAARFTLLVGEPAMHYLARWRMGLAQDLLARGEASPGEAAGRLGYRSEAAFFRAFKRFVGVPPGQVRPRGAGLARPGAAPGRQPSLLPGGRGAGAPAAPPGATSPRPPTIPTLRP